MCVCVVEIADLLTALVEFDQVEQARQLQQLFDDYLHLVRAASPLLRAPLLELDGQPSQSDESENAASVVVRTNWKLRTLELSE